MDREIRARAREALARIFTAAGFEVDMGGRGVDLSCVGDGPAVVVLCSDDPDEVERFDRAEYLYRCGPEEVACRKIIFSLNPDVEVSSSIHWGVEEFVRHAGEAALAGVLNRRLILDLNPVEPVGEEEVPGARTEAMDTEPVVLEEDEEDETAGPELLHIPPKVSARRALRIAGTDGEVCCRYVPCWKYRLSVHTEKEFRNRRIAFDTDEEGWLNAVNGLEIADPATDPVRAPVEAGAEILPRKIDEAEARERVISAAIERMSRRVRVRYEKGDAIFYEDRVLAPDEDEISIESILVYLPVWEIRGGSRIVEVDGTTGEILREPMDEGVEVF
ncbi:MAG: hypothetical protein ACXQTN_03935 [Methanoculleaceae archaeon]